MNSIYSRPMFQTPQQRSGGGIMAGVAPVNMEVDAAYMDDGGFLSSLFGQEEIDLLKEELTDPTFFFDPNDPIDQASLALMAIPGVNMAARLASMGVKGTKLAKQLYKIRQASEKLTLPAMAAGSGLIIGDELADPENQAFAKEAIDFAKEEIDYFLNPEDYEYSEEVFEQEIPNNEGGISNLTVTTSTEEAPAEEGGITSLPTSIWEARDKNVKSPIFMRDGEAKAAVTVEDLEESGFDNLTDYLNNMEFDANSGRYVLKKADGGIVKLANGGEAEEKIALPDSLENMLSFYEIDLEDFSKLSEEAKKSYIKTYKDRLNFQEKYLEGAKNTARVADAVNYALEGIGGLGQDILYSDFSKAVGIVDPTAEAPPEDASFMEDITRLQSRTAPTEEEINESLLAIAPPERPALPVSPEAEDKANPGEEGTVTATAEEPGVFGKVLQGIGQAVSKAAGYDLPDDEYRAYVESHGRRKLGESRMEKYNKALAAIRDAESTANLRDAQAEVYSKTDMQREIEYLQALKDSGQIPADTDIISLWSSTQSKSGNVTAKDIGQEIADLYESMMSLEEAGSTYRKQFEDLQEAGDIPADLDYSNWALLKAKEMVSKIYGISDSPTGASLVKTVSPEEFEKLMQTS
jgi:hypothetical protein